MPGAGRNALSRGVSLLGLLTAPAVAGAGTYAYWWYGNGQWLPPELTGDRAYIDALAATAPRVFMPELG
jgi:hypothetical protein